MAEKQIEKLQARINKKFKSDFIALLRKKGHFVKFCENTKSHLYAINVFVDELEDMLNERIASSDFCTIFVSLKNGSLEIAKVA